MPSSATQTKSVLFICMVNLISMVSMGIYLSWVDASLLESINDNLAPILIFCMILFTLLFFISHLFIHRILRSFFRLYDFVLEVQETKDYSLRIEPSGGVQLSIFGHNINDMIKTVHIESNRNRANTKRLMESQITLGKIVQYDNLTGLANRRYFMETLERAMPQFKRSDRDVALMIFDLDGLRLVNDMYGREAGDKLLIEAVNRARGLLAQGDLIARLGENEFVMLLHNVTDKVTLNEVAKHLAAKLSSFYSIEAWKLEVTASIGITVASDADFDIKTIMDNAYTAMCLSKNAGPSNYSLFAPHMKVEKQRRLEIANALSQAISKEEFYLVYQAKVNCEDKVVGYEALIRWHSDILGSVSPNEFIPIAEKSGKISQITFWVLEALCKDIDTFITQHDKYIKLSFNLSADDLKDAQLNDKIELLLKQHNVDGRNIEIEVTESAYLENYQIANDFFEYMSNINCSIALDDFGTGYSSLGYLTQINIDTLKIDKQFVNHITRSSKSRLVTKAIIDLGKQLGLEICAEGVETEEQATILKANGCHQLQGYLYSKPMSVEQLFFTRKV